jgi:phenol 2-monooxygenase
VILEQSMWMRGESNPDVLVKKMSGGFYFAPTRYEQLVCIHQGHVERVFRQDLINYGANDVQYGSKLVGVKIDEDGEKEFPVLATIERGGSREEVRAKYLVGADGARSAVRGFMGVEMEGDMTDELWRVMDLVVDSDIPDIRRAAAITTFSEKGVDIRRRRYWRIQCF